MQARKAACILIASSGVSAAPLQICSHRPERRVWCQNGETVPKRGGRGSRTLTCMLRVHGCQLLVAAQNDNAPTSPSLVLPASSWFTIGGIISTPPTVRVISCTRLRKPGYGCSSANVPSSRAIAPLSCKNSRASLCKSTQDDCASCFLISRQRLRLCTRSGSSVQPCRAQTASSRITKYNFHDFRDFCCHSATSRHHHYLSL